MTDFTHFLQRATTEDPFFKFLRMQVDSLAPGNVRLKLFVEPDFHTNRRGVCHGGPLAAMSDACMGWSCRTLGYHVVTTDIHISYIRPAPENTWVYGEGQVIHEGKNTLVAEVKFYNEDGKIILLGKGTYWIRHRIDLATDI